MFRVIWQFIHNDYGRRRFGIDNADIQHIRADLRFRLALVEYAYFGKSGRKVARSLGELKSLLGEKAMHRYLRSLDPDLRTQFVERFQSQRRNARNGAAAEPASSQVDDRAAAPIGEAAILNTTDASNLGSNVVSIRSAVGRDSQPEAFEDTLVESDSDQGSSGVSDSGERRDGPTAG